MATRIVWGAASGGNINISFSGNVVLNGTRIVNAGAADDDIALAYNEFVPDTNTLALWHLNEAAWTGAAGEVLDSGPNGYHGTALNGATTQAEWLDRYGLFDGTNLVSLPNNIVTQTNTASGYTLEAWLRIDSKPTDTGMRAVSFESVLDIGWDVANDVFYGHHFAYNTGGVNLFVYGTTVPAVGQWYHVAFTWDGSYARLWINGVLEGEAAANAVLDIDRFDREGAIGCTAYWRNNFWFGAIDEVRLSTIARYATSFTPHRYESGTVTLQYTLAATYPLKFVDWSLSTTLADGKVTKVEAYDELTQQWVVLAEDPNGLMPPIVPSGVYVKGPNILRFTLVPSNDTLQSATPVLDWVYIDVGETITVISNNQIIWGRNGTIGGGGISLRWSGNSTGTNVRIVNDGQSDDDIALAFNEFVPDANTIALYHMNEAAWTGQAGEVIDSSGNGYHGTIYNAFGPADGQTVDGWLDRSGRLVGQTYVSLPSLPSYGTVTLEGWLTAYNPVGLIPLAMYGPLCLSLWGYGPGTTCTADILYDDGSGWRWAAVTAPWPDSSNWVHLAAMVENNVLYFYVNGTYAGEASFVFDVPAVGNAIGLTYDRSHNDDRVFGVDEVRYSSVVRYTSDFSPHRFEPGTVTVQYSLTSPMRLTAIDWDGTFGASYGLVTQVEVYSSGVWVPVASDPAGLTPPLTGLSYTVTGPDIVRLTLSPKQDTLQSETPVLDWLRITLEPAYIVQNPVSGTSSLWRRVVGAGTAASSIHGVPIVRRQVSGNAD